MGQHHAWTQEPGRLQFIASQRVRHNRSDLTRTCKQDSTWTKPGSRHCHCWTGPLRPLARQWAFPQNLKYAKNLFLEMLADPGPWHSVPRCISVLSASFQQEVDVLSHGPFDTGSKRQEWGWQEIKSYVISSALFTLKLSIFIELKAGHCTHPIKAPPVYREVSCVPNLKNTIPFHMFKFLKYKWII